VIAVRKASDRGRADLGWLDANYSFSFAGYQDPAHMGFRALRVLNEDRIAPGGGFPTHPHREMEILTYVIQGGLEHRDSMGNGSVIGAGEFQRMSAGTGITHSEFNSSAVDELHLLQIWLLPAQRKVMPGYEQQRFTDRRNALRPVATQDGRDGSMTINQDTQVLSTLLDAGECVEHALAPQRHAWVQVVRGSIRVNGHPLGAGDGAALSGEASVSITADEDAELLLFDLA
jgi:redox-sensitive bicupin YhaK (pirin superfamily)